MKKIKFEYKITLAYLAIGSLWILFSDRFLDSFTEDPDFLTQLQTIKGWSYVIITGGLFFVFLRGHLNKLRLTEEELEMHKKNLQQLVEEKTRHLKEAQSQLLQAEKMAALGILTAGVAHEINNPLNYILGGYTGLETYFQENGIDDKKITLLMHHIKTGIDRSASIVSGLDQFSHSNELNESCDIHFILDNCLLMLNNQLKDRIEIKKDYSDQKPIYVNGNVGLLHQAFMNVLLNSIQSIEKIGIIEISTRISEQWVNIRISDTGNGISQENLPKITDPFFTTKAPGMGTGLGLFITLSCIKEHKGEMEIESELNKGTTVIIKLPMKLKNG